MNFISLAASVFISNYIFLRIINILPFKNKKLWQIIIISFADLSSVIGYLITFIISLDYGFNMMIALEMLGSILGILTAYIAIMMLIFDGKSLFKSKRLKEFERGINKKDEASLPKNIIAIILLTISIILLLYSIISIFNYSKDILISLIGTIIVSIILLIISIYLFISGKALHQKLKSEHILLYIKLPNEQLVYEQTLSKTLNLKQALNGFDETYILDEYGLIITKDKKYIVKGIMVTKIDKNILNKLNMQILSPNPYEEAFSHFQKYNRKKIILDESNKIKNISNIK